MPAASNPVRLEAEEFVRAELGRVGIGQIDRLAIAKIFMARGASRASIYRWIDDVIAAAAPQTTATPVPTPAERSSAPDSTLVSIAAARATADVLADLPTVAEIRALERSGQSGPAIMSQLQNLVAVCHRVLKACQLDEKVRNPRMMLQTIEALRKFMETTARISESVNNVAKIERFIHEVIAELREESPELAHRVLDRLFALFNRWDP